MEEKSDIEKRFRRLELELNIHIVRKEKALKQLKELKSELNRMDKKVDALSKEMISAVIELTKRKG